MVKNMVEYKAYGGRALSIAIGTLLVFLVLLGSSASVVSAEVIVDEQSSGFTKYGTPSFWKEASIGYNNHMFYTYNGQSSVDNYAMWKPSLSSEGSGTYTVYVYIPSNYADTTSAVYTIYHNGITDTRYVNQVIYSNVWVTLGDFYFSASGNDYVKLVDATGESSTTKRVGFDAVKWIKKEVSAVDGATFVSETIPDNTVEPAGQIFTKTWTLKNSGTTTWGSGYKLAYVSGSLSTSHTDVTVVGSISPGQSYTFSVPMKAPATSGTYREDWKLVNPQGTTILVSGSSSIWAQIIVSAPIVDGATFVSETIPDNTVEPAGQIFTKTWTLKNSGTTTWGSGYKLAYVSGSLSTSHTDVTVVGSISPGQSYTFSVPMKAPITSGTYREDWKLVNPQGTTILVSGSSSIWAQIIVSAPIVDGATFVSETIPDNTVEPAGQIFTKTWTLKNSGTTTWGSGYKLAYVSGSLSTSHTDVTVVGSVSPGQSYTFSVPMKAPTTSGTFTEYWKLVNPQGTTILVRGGSSIWATIVVPSSNPMLSQIQSPIFGTFDVVNTLNDCSNTKWCFNQHKTGGHKTGGGIGGADDTYAWDVNLNTPTWDSDNGKPVYAVASGIVTDTYGGAINGRGTYGQLLIEHNYQGNKWWSGYLHLSNIQVSPGQTVTENTVLGYISNVGTDNNHLHFVVYKGSNIYGGLTSVDIPILEKMAITGYKDSFSADDNINEKITNVNAAKFQEYFAYKNRITMSPIATAIVDAGNNHNMNSVFLMALAAWEGAWGTSNYAITRHNWFGYGALYSNPDNAWEFSSDAEGVDVVAGKIKAGYLLNSGTYQVLNPTNTINGHPSYPYVIQSVEAGTFYNGATVRGWIVKWNINSQTEMNGIISIMNDFISWHITTYGEGIVVDSATDVEVALRDAINDKLNQKLYIPPYLLTVDSFQSSISTLWMDFTSWVTQTGLTEKYDELYQAGLNNANLRTYNLIKARNSLNVGDIKSAEKYLKRADTYSSLSSSSFNAALEVFNGNLDAAQTIAQGIKDGSETSVNFGLNFVNPTAAEAADYIYIGIDYAIDKELVGVDEARKNAAEKIIVKAVFEQVKFDDLGGKTIEEYTNSFVDNRGGKYLFPTLEKSINSQEGQFAISKIIKTSLADIGITLGESSFTNLWGYITNELNDMTNSQSYQRIKLHSPGELRVYDTNGNVTGLVNGIVKEDIPESLYDLESETVVIFLVNDTYRYEVVGTDTGVYGLDMLYTNSEESRPFFLNNSPISTNVTQEYTVDWNNFSKDTKVTINTDLNSDGIFDNTTILQLPTGLFTYFPKMGIPNQEIRFNASSSKGSIILYTWDFGDGTNASGEIINHNYSSEGDYIVTLTVKDENGAVDKKTIDIRMDATPPTTTAFLSGTLGNNGWYISDIQINLKATDNDGGSGINKTEYSFDNETWITYTAPFNITHEGTTTVYYRTTDNVGNVESTRNLTVQIDKIPPSSIINPHSVAGSTYINFTWFNPPDPDFSHVMLYLNGTFKTNITAPQNHYNFTGLQPDTLYELGTHTVDTSGNINQTWVNATARTAPDTITPTPSITVISPNGAENWERGKVYAITWNYTGSPGTNVKIELLKNGMLDHVITPLTSIGSGDSGSYNWLINSTQTLGSDYKVIITSTTNSAYTDTSDNNFNISAQTGVNLIKNPGFESGTANWTFYTNGTGNFKLVSPGYEGNYAANLTLTSNGTNIQLYQRNLILEPKGIYRLSFVAYSTTGHDLLIKIFQNSFPYTDYGLNQTFDMGTNWQALTTEFTAANLTTTVNDGRLMFYLAPFVEAGDIYYIDDVRLEKIGVDNTPPAVIGNTPTGTNVLVTTPITVTFSEKMDQFATQEAFSISPALKGSFSWNGTNMTYIPDSNLAYNTSYTVTIGTGARDSAGNNLPSAYSRQFGTILPKPIIDCTTISSPGVYTLNVDIMNHPGTCINITSSNVIFDGTGHKIDGIDAAGASGVNVHNTSSIITNVTVTNLAVTDWDNGIYFTNAMGGSISKIIENSNSIGIFLNSSSFNNITDNNISNSTSVGIKVYDTSKNNTINGNKVTNGNSGIFFVYAFNTTASNNIMENNNFNFGVGGNLSSHFEGNNIDTSNLANGRPIYYVKHGKNTIYDGSTRASTFYCILCNNVTVKDLEMSNMDRGVYFWETSNSRIQNITVKQSGWGIFLRLSHDNTIRDSNFSTNNIQDYSETGVTLYSSDNNTFENNTFILNNYGIELYSSSKNTIYNNYFNNTNNLVFRVTTYENVWNTTKKPGTNIIGGSYLGGNFWANPSGNGFSQICLDSNNDGLCDLKYSLNNINIDYLPLKYKTAIPAGITVVSPNGGENWTRGTTQTIRWTSTGNTGAYVKIELLKAGVLKSNIIAITPNDGTHPWLIPATQAPGTDYKVRITTGAGYTDTSDDDFTIPTQNITVITPNGGENWRRGTTQTIRWNSSGFPGTYVRIELLKGGVLNRLIVASTPNDGAHPWPILVAQAPGTDYKVKITSTTNAAYNDISEDNFTIPVPTITVLSPNGTDIWTRGTTKTIKWNSTESPGTYVKIELLRPGKPNQLIISATLNDGSHPWIIPPAQAPGSDYKVKITSTINVSNNDTSDSNFTIPVPSFTVVSPNGGENWTRGAIQTIRWNSTENPKGYVKIELLKPGKPNQLIISATLNDGSHPWLIPPVQAPGSDYKVKITSTINVSNNDTSNDSFTIPIPSITVVTPNDGESWIRGTTKTINWTSTENPRSYVRIELLKGGVLNRVVVAGTLNDGSHPWLIPGTQAPGTDYQVRITSTANISIKDTSDNNFTIPVPSITVATPNGGETWRRGTTQTIKWNSTESLGTYVKIELLKAGVLNRVIVASTINDGSHPWPILAAQTLGSDYKIRINSTINPANTDSGDNNFNITG